MGFGLVGQHLGLASLVCVAEVMRLLRRRPGNRPSYYLRFRVPTEKAQFGLGGQLEL